MRLRPTPRSADRTRSPAGVSQKREYFMCGLETIGDFALRLFPVSDVPFELIKVHVSGSPVVGVATDYKAQYGGP
jgi:hypothetical protein